MSSPDELFTLTLVIDSNSWGFTIGVDVDDEQEWPLAEWTAQPEQQLSGTTRRAYFTEQLTAAGWALPPGHTPPTLRANTEIRMRVMPTDWATTLAEMTAQRTEATRIAKAADEAWSSVVTAIPRDTTDGLSVAEIAKITDLTRYRIYQILKR